MGCRIGMATDVAARVQALKRTRKVPEQARYKILKSGLTYNEAHDYEQRKRRETGCDGSDGGLRKEGRVWSVYRIDW